MQREASPTRTLTSRRKRTPMLFFVFHLLPFVQHFAGEWRRSGRKLEDDPAVLCLEPRQTPSSSMDQIGSCLPKRNFSFFGYFFITSRASSSIFKVVLI